MSVSLTPVYSVLHADARVIPALQQLGMRNAAHLVGGCIRDSLLGRSVTDVDLVVQGDALSCARTFARAVRGAFVVLDVQEGVGRVVHRGVTFDVSELKGSTLRDDLARRDFTINAMACRLTDALAGTPKLIDPQGGEADLQRRKVIAVSEQAFDDDPLRILRAFRFAAQLGFSVDRTTVCWLQKRVSRLSTVSAERIQDELSILMTQPQAVPWIRRMHSAGVLLAAIPELADVYPSTEPAFDLLTRVETLLVEPHTFPHLDLSSPLACALEHQISGGRVWAWLVRLAALLIGDQPSPHRSEGWIESIATERLRLSNREHKTLKYLIRLPEVVCAFRGEAEDRALYAVTRGAEDDTIGVVLLALAMYQARSQDVETVIPLLKRLLWLDTRRRAIHAAPRLVTGHDLMTRFALQPGPQLGMLLSRIEEEQAIGRIQSGEDAYACVDTWLADTNGEMGK